MTSFIGIDPSTKTGFVRIEDGNIIVKEEYLLETGMHSTPREIKEFADNLVYLIPKDSIVCIEGFAFSAKGDAISFQFGLGYAIRFALSDRKLTYFEPTPTHLKKFVTGKGTTKKENMIIPMLRHWGFEHESDNVRDAFALAKIAEAIKKDTTLTSYQQEVIKSILNPKKKGKKK